MTTQLQTYRTNRTAHDTEELDSMKLLSIDNVYDFHIESITISDELNEMQDKQAREMKRAEVDRAVELANAFTSIMTQLPTLPEDVAMELAKAKIATPKKGRRYGASNPNYGEGRNQ